MLKNVLKVINHLEKECYLDLKIDNGIHFVLCVCGDVSEDDLKIKAFEERFLSWNRLDDYLDSEYFEKQVYEDFFNYFHNEIPWKVISRFKLTEEFMLKNKDYLFWDYVCKFGRLTEDQMVLFEDKLNWRLASYNQEMSEDFMEKYQDKIDWTNISLTKKLSKEFVVKFEKNLNLDYVRMRSDSNGRFV